jgi:hypothetical protein
MAKNRFTGSIGFIKTASVRKFAPIGSQLAPEYKLINDRLVYKGDKNIYKDIQSHKSSVDLKMLIDRFQNGDVTALSQRKGVYGDFTNTHETINDLNDYVGSVKDKMSKELQSNKNNKGSSSIDEQPVDKGDIDNEGTSPEDN